MYHGGLPNPLDTDPLGCRPPSLLGCRPLPGARPPPGYVTCLVCWEANQPTFPPPVDRMTDACENITLPQTSFAGGNYNILIAVP